MDESAEIRRARREDPDPSDATIVLVNDKMRGVLDSIQGLSERLETRLESMDKAQALFNENLVRVPTQLDRAIGQLEAMLRSMIDGNGRLYEQRLAGLVETIAVFKEAVNQRFELGEAQTGEAARGVKSAVDAAFAAAKEAVAEQNKSNATSIAKSEMGFTKQIDQLAEGVKTGIKNTDDKLTDLKDRIALIEGRKSGSSDTVVWIFGCGAFLYAVLASIAVVVSFMRH